MNTRPATGNEVEDTRIRLAAAGARPATDEQIASVEQYYTTRCKPVDWSDTLPLALIARIHADKARLAAAETDRDEQEEVANNYATELIGAEESIKKLSIENAGLREALQHIRQYCASVSYQPHEKIQAVDETARRLLGGE